MVDSVVALGFLVVLEHGEIHHPQWGPAVFQQSLFFGKFAVANFQAQSPHGVIHHLGLVCAKEQQVAVFCATARQDVGNRFVVQVFDNR